MSTKQSNKPKTKKEKGFDLNREMTKLQRSALMIGVEFGYRQAELGLNIQAAREKAKQLYDKEEHP